MTAAPVGTARTVPSGDVYRLLFERSHDAVQLTAPDGRVMRANAAACRMFGMTEDEIRAAGRAGLVDQEDPRLPVLLAERARTGHVQGGLRYFRRGGIPFEGEVWSSVFLDENGEERTWMVIRDVSDRVRAEEQVRLVTAVLAAQAEASPDGILALDPQGAVVSYNRLFLKMWGLDPGQLAAGRDAVVRSMLDLAGNTPEAREAFSFDPGPAFDLVTTSTEIQLPAGRTFLCHSSPVWVEGVHLGRVWHHRDVTDLKKAETDAQTTAAILAAQLDASPEGLLAVDSGGQVVAYNRRLLELWGFSESDMKLDRAARLARIKGRVADPDAFVALIESQISNPDAPRHAEILLVDGRIFEQNVRPLDLPGGPGLAWFYRDISALRKAEAEARTNAAILAAQFDASPDAVEAIDSQGRVVAYNQRILDMWGVSEGDTELDRPARLDRIRGRLADPAALDALVQEQAGHPDVAQRAEIATADGRILDLHVRPLDLPGGPGHAWFYRDITDRVLMERSLRRSEEQFRDAFEHAPIGMAITTPAGTRIRVNRALCQLLGYSEADLLAGAAMPLADADRTDPEAALRAPLAEGAISHYEMERRYLRSDGQEIRAIVSVSPVLSGHGGPPLVLRQVVDVTQARRAEEALRASEQRLRSVLNAAVDGIVVIDRNGVIEAFNPAAEQIFGYSEDELLRRNVSVLMPDPYAREHSGYIERYLRTGEARIIGSGREVTGLRKDGTTFPLELAVAEMQGEDGLRFVGTIRDITGRKRAEEALLAAQKAESLGVLAGGIAHQLNNLLTSVMGNAGFAAMQVEAGSPAADALRDVEDASARAGELTRALLAYSGAGPVTHAVAGLSLLADEVLGLLRTRTPRGVSVVCELAADPPPVRLDPALGRELLTHLLMNAFEALAERDNGGEVRVATRLVRITDARPAHGFVPDDPPAGDYVLLEVSDNGPGIDPEVLSRVFDPFFSTRFMGRGLGLAAVLGIVRTAGGAIRASSEPGRGAAFLVLLPVAAPG